MRGSRRKSREDALKILYQLDLNQALTPETGVNHFEKFFSESGKTDEFTRRLVEGVYQHLREIDAHIKKASEHWRKERMAVVDLNILRLGVFEFFYCREIPATITINEMVELAKFFSSQNSPKFINGILDHLQKEIIDPEKAK